MRKFIDIVSGIPLTETKKKKKHHRRGHTSFFGYVYGMPSCQEPSGDGDGGGDGGGGGE